MDDQVMGNGVLFEREDIKKLPRKIKKILERDERVINFVAVDKRTNMYFVHCQTRDGCAGSMWGYDDVKGWVRVKHKDNHVDLQIMAAMSSFAHSHVKG